MFVNSNGVCVGCVWGVCWGMECDGCVHAETRCPCRNKFKKIAKKYH